MTPAYAELFRRLRVFRLRPDVIVQTQISWLPVPSTQKPQSRSHLVLRHMTPRGSEPQPGALL